MSDIPFEGQAPKKEKNTDVIPMEPKLEELKGMFQIHPSVQGNELIAIVKMLEAINKNLSFLATTIHAHLNPEAKKNG